LSCRESTHIITPTARTYGASRDRHFKQHATTRLHELEDDLAFRTEQLRALGDERLLVDWIVAERENTQGHAKFRGGGL
jgi:hypothetical protein